MQIATISKWINFDLNFIFKSSGRNLLEKLGFFLPSRSLSQEIRKTLFWAPPDTSITALVCIFSSTLNSTMENWKYRSRELIKAFCVTKKKYGERRFLQPSIQGYKGTYIPISSQTPYFLLLHLLQRTRQLTKMVRINKMVNEHDVG